MLQTLVSRTRRNHGLEHATIHVLSQKHRGFGAQGNSTPFGFYLNIYGDVAEEDVKAAVEEAHRRMRAGESHLAVHPNCGTVLVTSAAMAAVAAQASFGWEQRRLRQDRLSAGVFLSGLPLAVVAAALALIVSRPIGMAVQAKYTTDGDLGNLRVAQVSRIRPSWVTRLFQLLLGRAAESAVTAYRIDTVEE